MTDRSTARPRVAIVCLGNICRSPMAAVVLQDRLRAAGLEVEVVSAGTGGYHVGDPMDRRAAETLRAAGYDPSRHRARRFDPAWFEECDLVLAMDRHNESDLLELAGTRADRVRMFRAYDPLGSGDVPDPYYGGPEGFDEVLAVVERTADAIVTDLRKEVSR